MIEKSADDITDELGMTAEEAKEAELFSEILSLPRAQRARLIDAVRVWQMIEGDEGQKEK